MMGLGGPGAGRVGGPGLRGMGMGVEPVEEGVEVEVVAGWDAFVGPETVEPVRTGFCGSSRADHSGRRKESTHYGKEDSRRN